MSISRSVARTLAPVTLALGLALTVLVVETALVTGPVTPDVPEVPTGPASGDLRGLGSAALLGADALDRETLDRETLDREATVLTTRAEPRYLYRTCRAPALSPALSAARWTWAERRRTPGGPHHVDDLAVTGVEMPDSGGAR